MAASSNSIETAYINSFRAGFEQQFQQMTSRLRPFVEVVRQKAEFQFYDRIGLADDMSEVSSRYGDNPNNEIEFDRRRIGLRDFELGKYIDEKDLLRVAMDPTNDITVAMVRSANRKIDDIIIGNIYGTANTGKKGETEITFTGTNTGKITVGPVSNANGHVSSSGVFQLGSANTEGIDVAKDFVYSGSSANSNLTLDKLKAVRETMLKLEAIDQDAVLNCFITSAQARYLLSIEEVINSDYATRRALEEGKVTTFMGYRFIHSERLKGLGTSGSPRQVIVSLPQAYKLAIAEDLNVDMWRDTSKKNIPYVYLNMSMDGTRMWGEVLAKINCVE